jgi:hypothetical protein
MSRYFAMLRSRKKALLEKLRVLDSKLLLLLPRLGKQTVGQLLLVFPQGQESRVNGFVSHFP